MAQMPKIRCFKSTFDLQFYNFVFKTNVIRNSTNLQAMRYTTSASSSFQKKSGVSKISECRFTSCRILYTSPIIVPNCRGVNCRSLLSAKVSGMYLNSLILVSTRASNMPRTADCAIAKETDKRLLARLSSGRVITSLAIVITSMSDDVTN